MCTLLPCPFLCLYIVGLIALGFCDLSVPALFFVFVFVFVTCPQNHYIIHKFGPDLSYITPQAWPITLLISSLK